MTGFLHRADLTPPCKDHPPPQNHEAPKLRIEKRFQGHQNHMRSRVQAFPFKPWLSALVPGVEGQDPASLGSQWHLGLGLSGTEVPSCRSRLLVLCPQVTPSPLSQGEGGHRQESQAGVYKAGLTHSGFLLWSLPRWSLCGLGDSGGGRETGQVGNLRLTSQEVMSVSLFQRLQGKQASAGR